jgi:hypothetical protein
MKRTFVVTLIVVLACVALAGAQTEQAPKPGPELKKLDYFTGTWHTKGNMKSSVFGPAGKINGSLRAEWAQGNFFQIRIHEEQNSSGKYTSLSIVGYDADKKVYTAYSFNGEGRVNQSEGMLAGDIWSWSKEYKINGEVIKTRTIIKPTSATSYDFKWEIAPAGSNWITVQEGKATKTG